uniref:Ig-like domain-containing protein n=1 Tax=Callorhinchus milii TaxID=7868 RepID=A0A4W3H528_CALMI
MNIWTSCRASFNIGTRNVVPNKTSEQDQFLAVAIQIPCYANNNVHLYSARHMDSSKSQTLVCETAEFYPEDVTLTWYKNGNEVKTGINDTKKKNSNGLYKVSSSMEETESVQSGVIYTCVVSHVSLRIPAVAVYAVSEPKQNYQ